MARDGGNSYSFIGTARGRAGGTGGGDATPAGDQLKQGQKILHDTRDAGLQAILPFVGNIQESVFEAVRAHHAGLTAEEVQEAVGCSLNSARSRLTELFQAGRLVVIGKRANKLGTRKIAVYAVPINARPGVGQ